MRRILALFILLSGAISSAALSGGAPRSAEVRQEGDRPVLYINGKPKYPAIYALTDLPGGRLTWEEMPQHNIRRMAEAGVRIFQFSLFFDQMWQGEGERIDISVARKLIRGVTEVSPDASVIIRLHVHPPQWWYAQHRDECVKYADGEVQSYDESARFKRYQHNDPADGVIRYSFASKHWRETMTEKVAEFCQLLAKTEEGNAVIGFQVAGGIYGEWHHWGFINNLPDVSQPMQSHFRDWLREKYVTEEKLRAAWKRKDVSIQTAQVPDAAERSDAGKSLFLDLSVHRNVADYYECQHALVADSLIHFSETVKLHWNRPVVVGAFYGYFFPMFSKEATGGHLALQKVLKSKAVDFLAGPQCYFPSAESLGDPARSRGLTASCRLHGKLWLDEYDTQPNISSLTPIGAGTQTPGYEATVNSAIAVVKRNMAVSAVPGHGFWFFDFGVGCGRQTPELKDNGSNGWWDYPPLLTAISETTSVFTKQALKSYKSDADVLMVYDTDVYYELSTKDSLLAPVSAITSANAVAVWKAGVAADYVHLGDLSLVNLDQYKVVIFNNTFRITRAQRSLIKEKVQRGGRHVIWYYAPGFSDGFGQSIDNMEATTGFKLAELKSDQMSEVEIDRDGVRYRYGLGKEPIRPLFYVTDPEASLVGTYTQERKPAIARKSLADCISWFVGLPENGTTVMKQLLQRTPAHIYGMDEEIFYVGSGMLILHTAKPGLHLVRLKNGKTVECMVPAGGATIILDADTGKALSP